MPLTVGQLGPILSQAPPQGQGARTLIAGMESLGQGFRDKEAKRRARELEEMARRQQTETERRATADEEFRAIRETTRIAEVERKVKREGFEKIMGMMGAGQTEEARAYGKLIGVDLEKVSPQELQAQYEELHREGLADEEKIAKILAQQQESEVKEWTAESKAALPGKLEAVGLGAAGTEVGAVPGGPEQAQASMQALEQDFGKFIDAQARGALDEAASTQALGPEDLPRPGMQMGMGLPGRQAVPPQAAPGPPDAGQPVGPPVQMPQQAAPPQQAVPPGAAMGMGMPQPSPTALRMGGPEGVTIDPRAVMLAQRDAAIQAATTQGTQMIESMAKGVMPHEKQMYAATAEAYANAVKLTGGDGQEAFKMLVDDNTRQELMRVSKERGQQASIRAARAGAGRKDVTADDRRYDVGRRTVEKVVGDSGGIKQMQALQGLSKIPALLRSDSVTAHEAARTIMARQRGEKGAMSEGDIKRSTGTFGAFETVGNWMSQLERGGLSRRQREAMATEVEIMIGSTQKQLQTSYEHAQRAAESTEKRSGAHGRGGRSYIEDTFNVETDPYLQFLRRRPARAGGGSSKLGTKYAY